MGTIAEGPEEDEGDGCGPEVQADSPAPSSWVEPHHLHWDRNLVLLVMGPQWGEMRVREVSYSVQSKPTERRCVSVCVHMYNHVHMCIYVCAFCIRVCVVHEHAKVPLGMWPCYLEAYAGLP